MIYVGIDIAKTNHYASIVNSSTGEVLENPFLVTNNKHGFDSYTKDSFGQEGQIRLANCLIGLDKKGVKWMMTNHNTSLIQTLYKDFQIIPIVTNRNINSKGNKRKNSGKEVIVINYEK